ncbi:MAG: hypothetical protein AB1758_29665, partial [Candidatus Eremiobacterota bacterium]
MRRLALVLLIVLVACGSDPAATGTLDLTGLGRARLVQFAGQAAVDSLDSLGPPRANEVYLAAGRWVDDQPELQGTVAQAGAAVAAIAADPNLGPLAVAQIVRSLSPDPAQGFLIAFGGTRGQPALDSLTSLVAASPRQVELSLAPGISSLAEFHGLRHLSPAAMPPGKRDALRNTRLAVPPATTGQEIQKVIKLSDLESYLSGRFDPEVGGFV